MFTNHVINKKLVLENAEKSYVVNGITHLFSKFVLVNFENDTYRYLAGTKPRSSSFPSSGEYDALRDFVIFSAKDDEDKEHLRTVLGRDTLINNLNDSGTHLRYEFRINHEDDTEKWDSLNIICLKRSKGMPQEVLFTCQDVSTVKAREIRSYEALKQAYQAVESANNAKTSFLSSMSHDIRTPMNGIIGMTAIAAAHINEPERVSDCLQKITTASKHLLGLINEVLDMSKIESGKIDLNEEEFKLSDLIDNLLTMVKPHVEAKQHSLDITINNVAHEMVIGDSLRIQQVFMNLMSNAIKYTPNGGNIKLIISEKPTNQGKSGFYEFIIEDNGIGMSEKFLEKIFEPFLRAEDDKRVMQVQGTGLGMPIARNIVRMMGGDIQVESKLDVGTKVTVTFFLKLQDENEINYEEFIDLPVLVTDDDEMSCRSACNILNELGMKSEWVLSGKEALQRVVEKHQLKDDFFAVILDWKMDEMDGIATAKAIRKEVGEDIPIIIISAYDWSEIEQEARKAGVNAFISKPLFKSRMVNLFNDLVGISKEKIEESNNALSSLEKLNLSDKRVLLVEDNDLNLEIAKEILEFTGVTVECAKNGAEAVDRVASIPDGYYDLVLMDIQMPVMNGYEATRAIRALDRNYTKMLPIIAMTANAFVEDVHMAKGAGMNAHISKPLDLNVLANILRKWVL
jgi:signal transduction histidine kinase/CheY-like chemotaxis protein